MFYDVDEAMLLNIDGGKISCDWTQIAGGAGIVVACVAVAATAPISIPTLAAGGLCACAAIGGAAMGTAIKF